MTASPVADLRFRRPGPTFMLWWGMLIGPIAWGADLQISYSLVPHACSTGHHYVLHIVTAVAFITALSGAIVGAWCLAYTRGAREEGGSVGDRSRFMAVVGIGSSIGFALLIIAMAIPRFVLSPCD